MAKCLNLAHPELQNIIKELDVNPIELAAEISLFQDENNTDEFPSAEYLQKQFSLPFEDAIKEFKAKYKLKPLYQDVKAVNKILESARDNTKYDQIQFGVKSSQAGFSVAFNPKYGQQTSLLQQYDEAQAEILPELQTAVMNYFEAIGTDVKAVEKIYFNGKEIDANAKANTLLNTVEYVEGRLKRDTLPEEASHIWLDMAGGENNPMVLKMMNDVTKFKIYEEVVREYHTAYKGNDILLRKEAVGKVIASYMVNQFTGEPTLDELGASWFERLWNKIKSFFVGNKYKTTSLDILKATKDKVDSIPKPDTAGELLQLSDETIQDIEPEEENVHKEQYVLFKRRLAMMEARLKGMSADNPNYESFSSEVETLKNLFETAQTESDYTEIGQRTLDKIAKFIDRLEAGETEITAERIEDTFGVIEAFTAYPGLADYSLELQNRLFPFGLDLALRTINENKTEDFEITEELLNKQIDDVNAIVSSTGAVANSSNYIVRTVGTIVKAAQNRISTESKKLTHEMQNEVDKLISWGKRNNMSLEQVYSLFVQEYKGTSALVNERLETGEINPSFSKIQKNPELKSFYDFYIKQTGIAGEDTHTRIPWSFIPNIKKKKSIIEKWKAEDIETEEFQTSLSEELFADLVSNKAYRTKLTPEEKSIDLGEALLKFRAFGIKYKEMSTVLPHTRILQKQLEKKRTKSGKVIDREFRKSTNSKVTVLGINSNRWKMIDAYIDMQVKGRMKTDQGKPGKVIDQLMAYNSLLRIGLSPITAVSNVVFGDISNFIEGIGGRFYTIKELHQAGIIFTRETMNKDSKTNILLEIINPLQELSDYENISKVRIAKKFSPEKLKEFLYSPQKAGEKWLQTRTMIAIMLHTKVKSIDGKTELSLWEIFNNDGSTKEGFEFTEQDISKLRDKIQRVNEMVHGRYSSRDAAALSQNVIYRMVSQFRKWIPTQVENRIMREYFDSRLGVSIEGRYHTFNRTFLQEIRKIHVGKAFYNLVFPLINAKKALETTSLNEMEIYNMRKMMVEIIMAASSILLFALVAGADDDDEKLKSPLVKFGLTLLNRASADLTFFYSAREINKLGTNSIPLAKTTGDIIDAILVIPKVIISGEYEITRGSNKGRYKIEKEITDVVPVLNPIFGQMRRILSENKLEELN